MKEEIRWSLICWFALILFILGLIVNEAEAMTSKEVRAICEHYNYDRCDVLVAISFHETRGSFNPRDFNRKEEAYGLMQLKCTTAKMKAVGLKYGCEQLFNPKINIRFAIKYLEHLEKKGHILTSHLVSAWNAGNVYYCKTFRKNDWDGGGYCYPGLLINDSYVHEVMKYYYYIQGE